MITRCFPLAVLGGLILALGACATPPPKASAVRFHSGFQPSAQSVALQPADPALARSLEFSAYANAVGRRLEDLGFKPAADAQAADLIGQISYSTQVRSGPAERSPVSIGVGVGGVGSNVGVSVGSSIGLGERTSTDRVLTSLSLRLTPRGATTALWEGRAQIDQPAKAAAGSAVPQLIEALLADFPGPSGVTTTHGPPATR